MAAEPCSTATTRDLEQLEKQLDLKLKAARNEQDLYNRLTDKALETATSDLTRRLAEMNNFRNQVLEEREVFVRKDAYQTLSDRLARIAEETERRISGMEKTLAGIDGSKWAFGVVVTLVSIAIAAAGVFLGRPVP